MSNNIAPIQSIIEDLAILITDSEPEELAENYTTADAYATEILHRIEEIRGLK